MAMKKIKPKYGKVVPPAVKVEDQEENQKVKKTDEVKKTSNKNKSTQKTRKPKEIDSANKSEKESFAPTSDPNPFLQSKDVLKQSNLTKIGYRMRSDYVELLGIEKKLKKGSYTLEAVLDDALTFYFENSEDGKETVKKAQIFYS